MKTGTKIALWVAGIAVVSVGGYFIWKSVKKSREKKDVKDIQKAVELTDKVVKDSLSKPLSQLIQNTQPKEFKPQGGGITNPNLINRSTSSIYQPLNFGLPNRI
jgi:hypothetical protein